MAPSVNWVRRTRKTTERPGGAPPHTSGHRSRLSRGSGAARAGLSVVAAVALIGGMLAASVAVATTGSGAATPAVATTATPVNTMYVLNLTSSSISSFAPGATGNVAPTSTVSGVGTTLNTPYYMALDPSGNVWVANFAANTIVEYTQAQLAVGGAPAPTVTLTATANSIDGPSYLAFDRAGDLWVTNQAPTTGSVVEFTPSQLAASGAPTPKVTITSNGSGSINIPGSLAFDGQGNLWVGNDTSTSSTSNIVSFTPAQLSVSGNPTPAVTLSPTAGSIAFPDALALTTPATCGWLTT